ncbi:MAG: glycosyltransferase family 2 protein [Polaromonas sp.]
MAPLLSIAIPTHNRARYAIPAIRSILAIADPRLEVVVSDTSTSGELAACMADSSNAWVTDPRLNYFRPQEKLDMTGNHNAALGAVTGEYVCLIGDDDTIAADALAAAAWAKDHAIDLIAPNVVANYVWPDFRSRFLGDRHASRLYFARRMGGGTVEDSQVALARALKNAAQGTDGLPKIYHGLVRRAVLEQVREVSGAYFHGSSPDVSGAIALALCSKRFVVADYPLTIPGASGGSNTGRSAMNTHKGALGRESQTKGFESGGWSAGVPRFFSVETVWAHAALETIARIAPEQVARFNFAYLAAVCRVLHPEYGAEIDEAVAQAAYVTGQGLAQLQGEIKAEMKRYRRERLLRLLKRLSHPTAAGGRTFAPGLPTVADAPQALAKHMATAGQRWEQTAAQLAARLGGPHP